MALKNFGPLLGFSVHTKTTLTFKKNTWRVVGTGLAIVNSKKKPELWNTTWPGDLLHTWTHTLGRVWEKPFLLHSFLSQQKTTLLTHNWEPCQPDHAGHTMADSSSKTSELWNTTWPEDSLLTQTHTSSWAGENNFWLHSFLSPSWVVHQSPEAFILQNILFLLWKQPHKLFCPFNAKKMILWWRTLF